MKKYYVVGRRQLELRDEPLAEPGPDEVLIRTRVSALSVGTEMWRYVNGGHYGGEGSACGYNSAGVVVAVGPEVTEFQPGDVAFAPEPHAELLLVKAHRAIRVPAGIDLEAAAFSYLPTLGLHALRSAQYTAGENVLVIGQGIVGVLAAQVARMVGARVVAFETDPARRGVADAVRCAHQDTRIAIVGIYRSEPSPGVALDLLRATFMDRDHFHNQHVRFIGCSNDPADDYPTGVVRWTMTRNMSYIASQIAAGAMSPTRAITHRFQWDELEQIYERLASGDRGMVGVTLHWD